MLYVKHVSKENLPNHQDTKPPGYKQLVSIRKTRILERIHADIVGPFASEGQGKKYALVIMDDYSRYAGKALLDAITQLETATGQKA